MDKIEQEKQVLREQVRFVGKRVETKIVEGEAMFINEVERMWIRSMVEKRGIDLSEMEDNRNLGNQARGVANRMGEVEAVEFTSKVVLKMLDVKDGSVFGKGTPITEESRRDVEEFIEEYLGKKFMEGEIKFDPEKYRGGGTAGSNWKMNTIYRIEAVLSATNKLMYILAGDSEEDGLARQKSEVVNTYLRQRVIRGMERFEGIERKEKLIIRHLPKGGMSAILEHLTGV